MVFALDGRKLRAMFSRSRFAWWSTLAGMFCSVWVCAGQAQEGSKTADSPAASKAPSSEYLIGTGDTLQVFVWRQPELSVTVPVRPDGRISTPLVEDLVAVGKTATQLAREIEKTLSEFVRNPEVNVIIQQFVGTSGNQVRVLGQVKMPGSVRFREQLTLLDAISEVGGLTEFASGNRARLVRNTNGESRETRLRVGDLMKGKIQNNIELRPGDIIVVPESSF